MLYNVSLRQAYEWSVYIADAREHIQTVSSCLPANFGQSRSGLIGFAGEMANKISAYCSLAALPDGQQNTLRQPGWLQNQPFWLQHMLNDSTPGLSAAQFQLEKSKEQRAAEDEKEQRILALRRCAELIGDRQAKLLARYPTCSNQPC